MKFYLIKSTQGQHSYCSIINESEDGYTIKICRDIDGYTKTSEDFIEKSLFELCLRTGYISEVKNATAHKAFVA